MLRRVLELQPSHAPASLLLAQLVAQAGQRDEALQILERAMRAPAMRGRPSCDSSSRTCDESLARRARSGRPRATRAGFPACAPRPPASATPADPAHRREPQRQQRLPRQRDQRTSRAARAARREKT